MNFRELKSVQGIAQCKAPQFSSCPPVATQPAFTSTSTRSVLRWDPNNRVTLAPSNKCPQEGKTVNFRKWLCLLNTSGTPLRIEEIPLDDRRGIRQLRVDSPSLLLAKRSLFPAWLRQYRQFLLPDLIDFATH